MMRWLFFLPLAVFAVLVGLWLWGLNPERDPKALPSQLIDKAMPAFALPALEGSGSPALASEDLADGQVKLINFFASWCVPCRAEHPHLETLAKESNLPIHGIAWRDEPEATLAWLNNLGNPYTRIGVDQKNAVGLDFGITGVPETFIIDAKGRVRYRQQGPLNPRNINTVIIPLVVALRKEAEEAS